MDEKRRLAPRRPALVTARARKVRARTRQCSATFPGVPMAHGQSSETSHGRRCAPWKADNATDPNAAEPRKLLEEGWHTPYTEKKGASLGQYGRVRAHRPNIHKTKTTTKKLAKNRTIITSHRQWFGRGSQNT